MDAPQTSRSGRQVKLPAKFAGMEVVDAHGRHVSVPEDDHKPPKPRGIPASGKKRGRKPSKIFDVQIVDTQTFPDSAADLIISSEQLTPEESAQIMAQLEQQARIELAEAEIENPKSSSQTNLSEGIVRLLPAASVSSLMSPMIGQTSSKPVSQVSVSANDVLPKLSTTTSSNVSQSGISSSQFSTPVKREPDVVNRPTKKYKSSADFDDEDVEIPDGLLEAMRDKRQITAFLIFCRTERPSILHDMPSASFSDQSKAFGNRWMALSTAEKTRYRRIAQKITKILQAERGNDADFITETKTKFKTDPTANSAFDLVSTFRVLSDNLTGLADIVSQHPDNDYPSGLLDVLLDTSFVAMSTMVGLLGQIPILYDEMDRETVEELRETVSFVLPIVNLTKSDKM